MKCKQYVRLCVLYREHQQLITTLNINLKRRNDYENLHFTQLNQREFIEKNYCNKNVLDTNFNNRGY